MNRVDRRSFQRPRKSSPPEKVELPAGPARRKLGAQPTRTVSAEPNPTEAPSRGNGRFFVLNGPRPSGGSERRPMLETIDAQIDPRRCTEAPGRPWAPPAPVRPGFIAEPAHGLPRSRCARKAPLRSVADLNRARFMPVPKRGRGRARRRAYEAKIVAGPDGRAIGATAPLWTRRCPNQQQGLWGHSPLAGQDRAGRLPKPASVPAPC